MAALNGKIFDVFSRLPAKSIIRFQSVCKDTESYVSEAFFLKQHCQNMLAKGDSGVLLVQPHDQVELIGLSSSFGIPPESVEFLSSADCIVASSNGLICGRMKKEHGAPLFICNLVTKTWVSIPVPYGWNSGDREVKVIFECLSINDYFLMITMADPNGDWSESPYLTRIYSTSEGLWKEAGDINFGVRNMHEGGRPVYVNSGLVYFMSDSGSWLTKTSTYYWPYVVRFDVKTSISAIIKKPKEARRGVMEKNCMLNIFKWVNCSDDRGLKESSLTVCLIKLRKTVFPVWVLEEGNKWKMVFKRPAWVMGVKEPNLTVTSLTVMDGNELVIVTGERRVYKIAFGGEQKAQEIGGHGCRGSMLNLLPYSNTLRSCGDGARPLPICRKILASHISM